MSNGITKSRSMATKPIKPKTGQLNVRIPEELIRRLNAVIGARGKYKSQSDFVAAILEARLKSYRSYVEHIRSQEAEVDPD